jgi:hypothetical protein
MHRLSAQDIFKSKFEKDERTQNRNKALVALLKALGAANLRQADRRDTERYCEAWQVRATCGVMGARLP